MIAMEFVGLHVVEAIHAPFVTLREDVEPHRVLPIFIGPVEAEAIVRAVRGIPSPRPMTHDLFVSVLATLGVAVEYLAITGLVEGAFHAELHLVGPAGAAVVATRPSDGIAVAARTGSPIYAAEAVLDEAGALLLEPTPAIDDTVQDFRHFFDTLDPADFLEHDESEGPEPTAVGDEPMTKATEPPERPAPEVPMTRPEPLPPPPTRAAAVPVPTDADEVLRARATKRLRNQRDFRGHLVAYVMVNAFLVTIWAVTSRGFFWPIFPMVGWGIGVVMNAWDVISPDEPSEEKIRAEMDRLRR